MPPPPGLRPPVEWGTEQRLRELFGNWEMTLARRDIVMRFTSPGQFADFFRDNYGPTLKAFEALDAAGQDALYADLVDLARRYDRSTDGTVRVPWTYLEAVIVKA